MSETTAMGHFTTRYGSDPSKFPDPETMCEGQCEGMGVVPIDENDMEEPWRTLWLAAEAETPKGGYHFVKCPDCNGTGKKVREASRKAP